MADKTIPHILSNSGQNAYDKNKTLMKKIFALFKKQREEKNLKEEFYDSYIDFARKLDSEGHIKESNNYMNICAMYYDLMDRPEVLIEHESFFTDLFDAFDETLSIKVTQPESYEKKYIEFRMYLGKMEQYYYTEVAIPSKHYNKEVCKEIISHLAG